MSSKLVKNGNGAGIVNPFATTILTLTVDDQFKSELKAPNLHPTQVTKILMNVLFDVMYGYIDAMVANTKDKQSESQIIQ